MSNENMVIKVKPALDRLIPKAAHPGEWYDLHIPHELSLDAGAWVIVNLGVCIELPEGYEAIIAPRSSTFRKYGVIMPNSIGIIDHAYCGDTDWWQLPLYAIRKTYIPEGARIAQFRIIPCQPECKIKVVDSMENESRGGLGSTGI